MRQVLLAFALLECASYAQQPPRPEFEVAAVKPTALDPSQVGPLAASGQIRFGAQIQGDKADYLHMTLRQLVSEAYSLQPFQIVCPPWFLEDRFDIAARMPAGAKPSDARLMLQSLLESRFQLAAHRESRELPVAALIVSPAGPKLTPAKTSAAPNPSDQPKPPVRPGAPNTPFGGMMGGIAVTFTIDEPASLVHFDARRVAMPDLARFLTNFGAGGGRPVVDLTSLAGEYDMAIDIPLSQFGAGAAPAGDRPADYAADPGASAILRSLRRYGLDLKNTKAPVEHFIVDRAERKPVAN